MTGAPHTKNIRKSDPVSRYQQYQEQWRQQKAPGEKKHKNLRWGVREHMLHKDEVVEKVIKKSHNSCCVKSLFTPENLYLHHK